MTNPAFTGVSAALEDHVRGFLRQHRLPGISAGLVLDQELAWSIGVGFADMGTGRPADDRTLYQIASISKTFTATAIVQLRDESVLDLDDPLVKLVPEFGAAQNPFGPIEHVTLRVLLTHASGLQNELPSLDPYVHDLLLQDDLLRNLDRVRVTIPPHSVFQYSNLAFRLLAEVVRRETGGGFPENERANILDPLGMTSTAFLPEGQLAERRAQGYGPYGFQDRRTPIPATDTRLAEGDGHLWSCVEDLARWVAQQFRAEDAVERGEGQILSGRSIIEMQRPTFIASGDWTDARGLGWGATRRESGMLVGHGGLMDGYNSHLCFSPSDKLGAIVFTNGLPLQGSAIELARALMDEALPCIRSSERSLPDVPPAHAPLEWEELLGRYLDLDDDEVYRIEFRDGSLVSTSKAGGEATVIVPTGDPLRFFLPETGRDLIFSRGPDGQIDGFKAGGYPLVRLIAVTREEA